MIRMAKLDVPELAHPVPVIVSEVTFGLICAGLTLLLRMVTDFWLPGAGPFALTVPLVLVATLFGRWLSGFICQTLVGLHAWYFVLPLQGSFAFESATDGPRVAVNLAAGYFVVFLSEVFRRAMRQAMHDRDTLMLELEHRVKNSFASIASVIRLQMRGSSHEEVQVALQGVLGRIESFAQAYSFLNYRHASTGMVNIQSYLCQLCKALEAASSTAHVRFVWDVEEMMISRDRAIAIGLLVNEVATNAIKHAFGENGGTISVGFKRGPGGNVLTVGDDGRGMPDENDDAPKSKGLGLRIIEALCVQAEATYSIDTSGQGTVFRFQLAA